MARTRARPGRRGGRRAIERSSTVEIAIPPFTYQMEPPVPAEPTPTLGARLLLVAHESVSVETVEHVLDVAYASHFARIAHPRLERSTLALPPRLRRHAGTVRFLARDEPFIKPNDVADLSNTLSVVGALLGGGVFLWQGLRQQRQARRDRVFGAHMLRVAEIERRIVELELSASLGLEPLRALQQELLQLKSEALDRFASGEIGDHRALSELIAPIEAARDRVGGLLLHVRENLEQQAEV